jgi:hypothetical protein
MTESGRHIPEETFLRVLDETTGLIDALGVPYAFIGSVASAALGRPEWWPDGEDIDVFVRPDDARTVLNALGEAGYATEEAEPDWLYKALKQDVLVDVIFKSIGDIHLDEEMTDRIRVERFKDRKLLVPAPEDLVVMKAVANRAETPGYWHEALHVLARQEIDWRYLMLRARRHGADRVLSLLLYARSMETDVPGDVIRELFEMTEAATDGGARA